VQAGELTLKKELPYEEFFFCPECRLAAGEVSEGAVGLSHLVRVFFLFVRSTSFVIGIYDLERKTLRVRNTVT